MHTMKGHIRNMLRSFPAVRLLGIASVAILAVILCIVLRSTGNISRETAGRGRELLDTSIRRAATACYAQEGSYPESLSYLEEHYGLQVNESRYIVFYEIFAPNLMPDITVLER